MNTAHYLICFTAALLFTPLSSFSCHAQTGSPKVQTPKAGTRMVAAKAAMRETTLTAYTRPRHVQDIVSEEAGRCIKVTADLGDPIPEDGVFAVLDTTFIDIKIQRNRVLQEKAQNRIGYLKTEVDRRRKLAKHAAVAPAALDKFQNELDQMRLELAALEVEERNLMERKKRHQILAPPGWKVIERRVEPGEWVAVGENLGKVGDFDSLLVPFSLEPEEYRWLKNHQGPLTLSLPDEGVNGVEVEAAIERISPSFDEKTRKIKVDLVIKKGLSEKRGGLRARLTIRLPETSGTVLIPKAALEKRYGTSWLTRPDGTRIKVVLLGAGPGDTYRVHSPQLKPGDKFLVTSGF